MKRTILAIALYILTGFQAYALTDLLTIDRSFYQKFAHAKEARIDLGQKHFARGVLSSQAKIYAAHENIFLQNFIDEAIARIFLNSSGENFCILFGADTRTIANQTGVRLQMAHFIAKECRAMIIRSSGEAFLKSLRPSKSFKVQRKFYFAFGSHKKTPMDSWTSMLNETYLVFDYLVPPAEIYKRIIHELFIAYDHKLTLGKGTFNTIDFKRYDLKNNNLFNSGAKKDLDEVLGIIPYPLIRFTFSMLRSFLFEDMIIVALFDKEGRDLPKDVLNNYHDKTCWDNFEEVGEKLFQYQFLFLPVEYRLYDEATAKVVAPHLFIKPKGITLASKLIQDKGLYFYDNQEKRNIDFCVYMSTPLLSMQGTFFSRGPRPRLGGGWGGSGSGKSTIKDVINDGNGGLNTQTDRSIDEIIKHLNQVIKTGKDRE